MKAIIWAAVSTKAQAADDKASLESQVQQAQNLCEQRHWQVVDVLTVPGHSRRYIDIHRLAMDALENGVPAFQKLLDHLDDADFDVLVVRDGDRFARTQTLHAYIVERTIAIGAKIYSLADGMIDDSNFRMWIAMGGYRASSEVDSLVKKRELGFDARAKRGLPVNSKVVDSHRLVRDPESGKALYIEVDETKRQEYLDLAGLILEGIAWGKIERAMYQRFGYGREGGGPHQPHRYHRILYTPSFWGHVARHFKHKQKGKWTREDGHPIPDGISIQYNVAPPMYEGQLAEQIKAELDRRERIVGRRSPQNSYIFSGLVICGACGYTMVYNAKGNYRGLRCASKYEASATRPPCDHTRMLNEKTAIRQTDEMLDMILRHHSLEPLTGNDPSPDLGDTLAQVDAQLSALNKEILVMINKQAQSPDSLRDAYDDSIRQAGERLEILKRRQADLRQQITVQMSASKQQTDAILDLEQIRDDFWAQDANWLNQFFHRLLGDYRFVSLHGELVGLALPIHKQ